MTERWRDRLSAWLQTVVRAAGSTSMVVIALLVVVGYLVLGAVSGFTDQWYDVLHAWAGITAFLMVFVIRHAEGRDSRAALLKLDELVAATSGARDGVIAVEQDALNRQEQLEEDVAAGPGGDTEPTSREPRRDRDETTSSGDEGDDELRVLDDLDSVTELVREHETLYLRWSEGPAADRERGCSRDDEADVDLPGLSVATIVPEDWWSGPPEDWVARRICTCAELGGADRFPWLLTGSQVGWGPDHEPLVRLDRAVARIGEKALGQARERYQERFDLGDDSGPD